MDYKLITDHGLDYLKVVGFVKDNELRPLTNTSIVISAAITAYARIHISKLKLEIFKLGSEIYYSDTDSIVTDIELPHSYVSANKIGLLKLEHVLKEAYFISNKLYLLCNTKGDDIMKSRTANSSSLKYADFRALLNDRTVKTAKITQSKIHWDLGYVSIENVSTLKSKFPYNFAYFSKFVFSKL